MEIFVRDIKDMFGDIENSFEDIKISQRHENLIYKYFFVRDMRSYREDFSLNI
jgi:hypothetical protein